MPQGERTKHPSFGMVGISHASSSGTHLVGSDFNHRNFVILKIHRSSYERSLNRDWWGANEQLIEVWLTESQFVEMIGRPNMGEGIPCTLHRVMGQSQDPPPVPEDRKSLGQKDMDQSSAHLYESFKSSLASLEEAEASGKIGKTQLREIIHSLRCQIENFPANMKFVRTSFDEAMDSTINRAGVEIEATIAQAAMRLGVERLRETMGVKLLSQPTPDSSEEKTK